MKGLCRQRLDGLQERFPRHHDPEKHTHAKERQMTKAQKHKIKTFEDMKSSSPVTPVVSTADLAVDGGVHSVFDEPGERPVRVQSDVFLVRSGHVATVGMEIPEKHHILHTHRYAV